MNIVGSICKDTQKYANNQKENHIFFFPTSIQKDKSLFTSDLSFISLNNLLTYRLSPFIVIPYIGISFLMQSYVNTF